MADVPIVSPHPAPTETYNTTSYDGESLLNNVKSQSANDCGPLTDTGARIIYSYVGEHESQGARWERFRRRAFDRVGLSGVQRSPFRYNRRKARALWVKPGQVRPSTPYSHIKRQKEEARKGKLLTRYARGSPIAVIVRKSFHSEQIKGLGVLAECILKLNTSRKRRGGPKYHVNLKQQPSLPSPSAFYRPIERLPRREGKVNIAKLVTDHHSCLGAGLGGQVLGAFLYCLRSYITTRDATLELQQHIIATVKEIVHQIFSPQTSGGLGSS
ncbi:uncharacterized protein H6S33_001754 [Morchella sextelata]|uniref:uncharacterized protein n=1 Tax=Morchella sextelata TaxID=1174677 RepID=UPI001D050263|nr:uncharacterized protein H6S33_001754 [Morchella sextelata]KAH0608620.1 hypothetical protein H6S33_001754 [Morchella sextelata]